MTRIVRIAVSSFVAVNLAFGTSEDCGLPDAAIRALMHYQAWSVFWFGIPPEVPNTQELKILRNGHEWMVYSVATRTVYRITDSAISSGTCWQSKEWVKCLADLRSPQETSSITDLLLGKMKSPGPIDVASICTFSLSTPVAERNWRPSDSGKEKEELLTLLSEEVRRAVRSFGAVQDGFSNNFNVHDPRIWAMADVVDRSGKSRRLLVGVDIDHVIPPRLTTSTIRFGASSENPVVERILRDPLPLSLASK